MVLKYKVGCFGTAGFVRAEKDENVQLRRQTCAAPEFMQMSVRHLCATVLLFKPPLTEQPIHIKHEQYSTAVCLSVCLGRASVFVNR